jgi:hypothetical protein
MTKSAVLMGVIVALGIAGFFLFGQNAVTPSEHSTNTQAPIVDPMCEPGYERVGEGCIPSKEACEMQGDEYHYHEENGECHPHHQR